MGVLVETAREIVMEMQKLQPGEKKTLKISGYVLCQGVVNFIDDVVAEDGTTIDLTRFSFNWNNTEAQRRTQELLPFEITRTRE